MYIFQKKEGHPEERHRDVDEMWPGCIHGDTRQKEQEASSV